MIQRASLLSLSFLWLASNASAQERPATSFQGSSPQLASDVRGTIRMVFGRRDTILVATSTDRGGSFSSPVVVGVISGMHLGNTRGPTIASSRHHTMVLAIDDDGSMHRFTLTHASGKWKKLTQPLNSSPKSAPEGLASISADEADNFYAVWLDLRQGKQNQIYFSKFTPTRETQVENRLLYASPGGHVCECCRPSIDVAGGHVAVMFRNFLDSARDMYSMSSADGGRTFSPARKLGRETWILNACPMDGGDIAVDGTGAIATIWRRDHTIFHARPGEAEQHVVSGRSPAISRRNGVTWMTWQDGLTVKLKELSGSATTTVGEGRLPHVLALSAGEAVVAWEKSGQVFVRKY